MIVRSNGHELIAAINIEEPGARPELAINVSRNSLFSSTANVIGECTTLATKMEES
jgi:hypothetical protein